MVAKPGYLFLVSSVEVFKPYELIFFKNRVKSVGPGGFEPPTISKLLMRIPIHRLIKRELPPSLAGDSPLAWT
jgi:hypothetical protein